MNKILNEDKKDNKISRLVQYIVATAGQDDDPFLRELGPIHIIKYAYLADLAYAEAHQGQTYTGLNWKFHHYGPWSYELYQIIDPSLEAIGAEKKIIPSLKYENDMERWIIRDDRLFESLSRSMPLMIAGAVQKYVREFSADTKRMLHFCYQTEPMLNAAPGEFLDFSVVVNSNTKIESDDIAPIMMTDRQKKKRKAQINEINKNLRKKIDARKKKADFPNFTLPRYDETYFKGLEIAETLAGFPIKEEEVLVEFSNDIWKSRSRVDKELS